MIQRTYLLIALFFLGLNTSCEDERPLRYTLTLDVYEEGYIQGMIFTMDVTRLMMLDSITSSQINVEREIKSNWEQRGLKSARYICDSLGVVLDEPLQNVLLGVYSQAFDDGIAAGENHILRDSLHGELDPRGMARAGFALRKEELLSYLEDLELQRKPR